MVTEVLNHPIKNLITNKCEITSQNHGFVVKKQDVENHPEVELTHLHLNDNTVAGISLIGKNAFQCNIILNLHLDQMILDIYLTNLLKISK